MSEPVQQPGAEYVAELLARNHVYLSAKHGGYRAACNSLLNRGEGEFPPRIVVVVGAGASNAACGLPTGSAAKDRLVEQFRSVDQVLINEEIRRLTIEYRLEEEDFETVLLALSKFDEPSVLKQLGQIFNRRHHPWLGYEIIAHWLKHRFIDAVVNFNFDELLDQAVDDELGGMGYYRVLSDGNCPAELDDWIDYDRERFKCPLYIKPHGTASHKSSMRFTRSSYTLLPRDLHQLLCRLFDHEELCVIVVGHAMQSVEFNDILSRRGHRKFDMVFVDWCKPEIRWPSRREPRCTEIPLTRETKDVLESTLRGMASSVEAQFKAGTVPRGIDRHLFISQMFSSPVDLNREPVEEAHRLERYLQDRIYVEIAMAVAKAKGFLTSEHLTHGRVGRYYRLFRREPDPSRSVPSILSFCYDLGMQPTGYAADTVFLPVESQERLRRPTLPVTAFRSIAGPLAQKTRDQLSPRLQAQISVGELEEVLVRMFGGDEVEIFADPDGWCTNVFDTPRVLSTLTGLRLETRLLMESQDWDALACTAETGEWLLNEGMRALIGSRPLALIVADETHKDRLKEMYREQLGDRMWWMPWWMHNRHATVFLHNQQPVQAIFFERRLRALQIVPLILQGPDAELAFNSFVAYAVKARLFSQHRDYQIDKGQLRDERARLLAGLYPARPGRPRPAARARIPVPAPPARSLRFPWKVVKPPAPQA